MQLADTADSEPMDSLSAFTASAIKPQPDLSYTLDQELDDDYSAEADSFEPLEQTPTGTPLTIKACREKANQLGGLLLAMSGGPGSPAKRLKGESMEHTIKAYFPQKNQARKFKRGIKKIRSTSVVTQRVLPDEPRRSLRNTAALKPGELPPMKRQSSQGPMRRAPALAQAGRLQIATKPPNGKKPSVGSALNACRAAKAKELPASPMPSSGEEPREGRLKAGSGATGEERVSSPGSAGGGGGSLGIIPEKRQPAKVDYEARYMEHLRQLAEKKKQETMLLEKERAKMKETREKVKRMILQRAEQRKREREAHSLPTPEPVGKDEEEKTQEEIEEEERQKRLELQKLKKYYRSRYATMLQMIRENNQKKKEKENEKRQEEERKKAKLKEKVGVASVQSRFMEEKKKQMEELPPPPPAQPQHPKRHESLPPTRSQTFYKAARSNSPPGSARKPPRRAKDDQELEVVKEAAGVRKEQQEKLLKKQQEFLAELKRKKQKEQEEKEEEAKRKERMRSAIRESVRMQNATELERRQRREADAAEEAEVTEAKARKKQAKEAAARRESGKKEPNFLERNMQVKTGANKVLRVTDMAQWKRRNKIEEDRRVFHVSGGYAEMKRALRERGWAENKDPESICFDLMWTLKARDLPHKDLLPHQLVNHFEKNTAITTKVGLAHNLKNLIWFENVDIDEFYPMCFDLVEESQDFVEEFKLVKAESLLKMYFLHHTRGRPLPNPLDDRRVEVALAVCERRLMDLDDLIDDPSAEHITLITPAEWEVLSCDEKTAQDLALQKHKAFLERIHAQVRRKKKKKKKRALDDISLANGVLDEPAAADAPELLERVREVLEEMKKKFPQFGLNGVRNMWMLKPAGLSRGRGIQVLDSLTEIMSITGKKEQQWVVQKYMENSLIIHERKFDIRQWVLVTDWNPLTIWFYNEAYMRFSAKKYDPRVLGNKFIHLCNNSINKHSLNNPQDYDHDQDIGEGLMWDNETFQGWLEEHFGYDIWGETLQPQIKDIVIHSLKSVQDMVENRKNSFEIFGYDFMLDEEGLPWLIEVNSSPAMDYSTPITERMVKQCLRDTAKVVVDYHFAPNKKRAHVDTGLFELIHRSKRHVEKPLNSFGLNLVVQGTRIKP